MDKPISGNGITVYLVEELSDARLRCEQLKRYVRTALELIEKSPHKDHIFEVAGHLLRGIPEVLFRLDKALSATAMATSKMDYDMLKQNLRPEKADELENVLEDARLRFLRRQAKSVPDALLPASAAQMLEKIASVVENTGTLPVGEVGGLVSGLGKTSGVASLRGSTLAVETPISAFALRKIAGQLTEKQPSRNELVAALEDVAQQALGKQSVQILETAGSREDVMKGFKDANPSLTKSQLVEIADHWERNKDVVKDKQAAEQTATEAKESRFEEGKPADPTKNMTKEDAKEWKANTEEHKDNFKTAAQPWETRELQEMQGLLKAKGYDPSDAKKLQEEGMGSYELEHRLKKPSDLERTHGLKKKAAHPFEPVSQTEVEARFEEGKPADPTENMSEEDKKKWDKYHGKVDKLAWKVNKGISNPWKVA